jgi:cysteine desulfurase
MKRVYLDYAASTPVDSRVQRAMEPYWADVFGNPNALHEEGRRAREAVNTARVAIAGFVHAAPEELIFTSSGTEANVLAIMGRVEHLLAEGARLEDIHCMTSVIEHPSVLECFERLERRGARVDYVGVDKEGILDLALLERAVRKNTALVSVMYANNEIGTIQPVREAARIVARTAPEAVLHTDASQTPLFLELDLERLGVHLLSLDAQKLYGPKGIGALVIRKGTSVSPILCGGKQERGLRPGTQHVPAIVGFAKAYEIAERERERDVARIAELRDYMIRETLRRFPGARLNGSERERLPNNANFSFPDRHGELLVMFLDEHGIAAATRSACLAGGGEGSYVVRALAPEEPWRAESAVRFSLGRETTRSNIDQTLAALARFA